MKKYGMFHTSVRILVLLATLHVGVSYAEGPTCRIGFDIGSSGIRVGSDAATGSATVDIDYFADFWADLKLDQTIEPTIQALQSLPNQAGLPADCLIAGGAYSIWRLALDREGAPAVARILERIHAQTGAAVYVMPQDIEGSYGYFAAQKVLGPALDTPLILDIGGGSLQIAGAEHSWGAPLGQKAWRRLFCETIKEVPAERCLANPVGADARPRTAHALESQLAEARIILGTNLAVTAISPTIIKGIHPILRILAAKRLIEGGVDERGFSRQALNAAITLFQERNNEEILDILNRCMQDSSQSCTPRFVDTFVTDMLLLNALMDGLAIERLQVAAARISNVPGLLADRRAFDWAAHYGCYLSRLSAIGANAFRSDIGSCPP